jgi:hypothetical protein
MVYVCFEPAFASDDVTAVIGNPVPNVCTLNFNTYSVNYALYVLQCPDGNYNGVFTYGLQGPTPDFYSIGAVNNGITNGPIPNVFNTGFGTGNAGSNFYYQQNLQSAAVTGTVRSCEGGGGGGGGF